MKVIKLFVLLAFSLFLSSCGGIFSPYGYIAGEQKKLIIIAFSAMLLVVIPVLILTVVFSLKYREGNAKSKIYKPEWADNVKLEVFWWTIPIIIVGFLSVLAWVTSHSLDPYKELKSDKQPIKIEVISLNWKWLFIYPEYGIATVNYLQVPVNRPINFSLTSDAPMNSFWIPQIAGQIYSMTGMPTKLHILVNKVGTYQGLSANYSGEGFEGMKFKVVAATEDDFNNWVNNAKGSTKILNEQSYNNLVIDSKNNPVEIYVVGDDKIFSRSMKKYMSHGKQMAPDSSANDTENQPHENNESYN